MLDRKEKLEIYYGLIEVILDKLLAIHYYNQYKFMRDDLHSEGLLGLIHGVDTYDPARGAKEVTYVSLKVRGYILDNIRKYQRYASPLIAIEADVFNNFPQEEPDEEVNDYELIDKYKPKDEINSAIYYECIIGQATCQEIADEFSISRDSVQKRKRRLIKRLRKQISKGEHIYED